MIPRQFVIGLAGRRRSGKDTLAEALVGYGFQNVKMAGALKAMLTTLLEYQGDHLARQRIEGDLKEVPTAFFSGKTPRHAMQTIGTEWARDCMDADFWVRVTEARIARHGRVVISDVRFPNEVEMIRRQPFGVVLRIERPALALDDRHESEAHIDALDVDGVIVNDAASAAAFAVKAMDEVMQIGGGAL